MLKGLFAKHKSQIIELFWYGVFGVLTTLVNTITYWVFKDKIGFNYMFANVIAWIIAVAFAYVTNKLFVFKSRSWKIQIFIKEVVSFVGARLITGFMDMGMMYLMIDMWHFDTSLKFGDIIAKLLANIIVIIVNFIFSKLFIFKKNK